MSIRTIIAVLILIGILIAVNYDKRHAVAPVPQPVACTEEAMKCPDGSYVGRTGPSCQFAPCPVKVVPPVKSMGTIKGVVGLSPACGVIMDPPDPSCSFKAYETNISFVSTSGTFKTSSNASGAYSIKLPVGSYQVTAKGGETLPRCPTDTVVVTANKITTHTFDCESGLR